VQQRPVGGASEEPERRLVPGANRDLGTLRPQAPDFELALQAREKVMAVKRLPLDRDEEPT